MSTKPVSGAGGGRRRRRQRQPQPIVYQVAARNSGGSNYTPPRAPVRTPDNLNSKQYATFLDFVSVGPIEGWPSAAPYKNPPFDPNTGEPVSETNEETQARLDKYNKALLKDIYLNDTPILSENADIDNLVATDYNYEGYEIDYRLGEADQTHIPDFSDVESDETVDSSVPIKKDLPRTRSITDTEVTGVRITIALPQLQRFTTYGDVYGSEVELRISTRYSGQSDFTEQINDTIKGRSGDQYIRDYNVPITGPFPAEVRVERVTDDAADENTVNNIFWTTMTLIKEQKFKYPYSALVAARLDAEEHGSIPERSYRIRGIKVKIPRGVQVDQTNGRIIYPEGFVWDGTFSPDLQWCSDPAWLLYRLLTSERDGLGDYITEANLDRWTFFEVSRYSSSLVDDGRGGTEPRFSCNGVIQNADEAYKLINDLCSVMRCMPYWNTGTVQVSQDRPRDPNYHFNNTNVTAEGFKYSNSSLKSRHTVAIVSYFDNTIRNLNYEIHEDSDAIQKYGLIPLEVKAVFCSSRGQAARLAKWLLYTENQESSVVEFKASIDSGTVVRPGSIITIADQTKLSNRLGGRIVAVRKSCGTSADSTDDYLHIKTNIDFLDLNNPNLTEFGYVSRSGIQKVVTVTQESPGTTGAVAFGDGNGEFLAISLADHPTIDEAEEFQPLINLPCFLQEPPTSNAAKVSTWRVLSVIDENDGTYAITALEYAAGKYSFIEDDAAIPTVNDTHIDPAPDPPSNLAVVERVYEDNSRVKYKLDVTWDLVEGADHYQIQYRQGNGNWQIIEPVTSNEYCIEDVSTDDYLIRVTSVSPSSLPSRQFSEVSISAKGKTTPPGDVEGLEFGLISAAQANSPAQGILNWLETEDLDVAAGGKVLIKYSNAQSSDQLDWNEGVLMDAPGASTQLSITPLTGFYMAKFQDSTGNESVSFTHVQVNVSDPQRLHVFRESFGSGIRTIMPGSEDESVLSSGSWSGNTWRAGTRLRENGQKEFIVDSLVYIDRQDFDLIEDMDLNGLVAKRGGYHSPHPQHDFGGIYTFNVIYSANGGSIGTTIWDKRFDAIDTWASFDTFSVTGSPIISAQLRDSNDRLKRLYSPSSFITLRTALPRMVVDSSVTLSRRFRRVAAGLTSPLNNQLDPRGYSFAAAFITRLKPIVSDLTIDFYLLRVSVENTAVATGETRIDFPNAFYQPPALSITPFYSDNFNSVSPVVVSKDRTGFTVKFVELTGTIDGLVPQDISASIDFQYIASGYGQELPG